MILRLIKNSWILYNKGKGPYVVFWSITNACNLPPNQWKFVPFSLVKKAVRKLKSLGVNIISVTGGEPLLHPQISEIVKYIGDKNILISYLPTNGILLTEELALKLAHPNLH